MTKKQKKLLKWGIITLVLIAICVVFAIFTVKMNYSIWLAEYNAQMAANGIYKEDLHLLNQYWESVKATWMFVGALVSGIGGLVTLILGILDITDYL